MFGLFLFINVSRFTNEAGELSKEQLIFKPFSAKFIFNFVNPLSTVSKFLSPEDISLQKMSAENFTLGSESDLEAES
jgi:hypothetical protein